MPIGGSRIWATLRGTGNIKIDVVSGHPPHAAGRGEDRLRRAERKVRTYSALKAWLNNRRDRIVIVGLDGYSWIVKCEDVLGTPTDNLGEQETVGRFVR